MPAVTQGEILRLETLRPEQHFTEPPPRYSEATLVKELEDKGIGRPSTYASIISTIVEREYVNKDQGRFTPTMLGEKVSELLVKSFEDIFDVSFTARMEEELDEIEEGRLALEGFGEGVLYPVRAGSGAGQGRHGVVQGRHSHGPQVREVRRRANCSSASAGWDFSWDARAIRIAISSRTYRRSRAARARRRRRPAITAGARW